MFERLFNWGKMDRLENKVKTGFLSSLRKVVNNSKFLSYFTGLSLFGSSLISCGGSGVSSSINGNSQVIRPNEVPRISVNLQQTSCREALNIPFNIDVVDPDSQYPLEVTAYINGQEIGTSNGSFGSTLNPNEYADGVTNTLRVEAWDYAGGMTSTTVPFNVDVCNKNSLDLILERNNFSVGEDINVRILAHNLDNWQGFDLVGLYNPDVLSFKTWSSYEPFSTSAAFSYVNQNGYGEVLASGFVPVQGDPINGDNIYIMNLVFSTNAPGQSSIVLGGGSCLYKRSANLANPPEQVYELSLDNASTTIDVSE